MQNDNEISLLIQKLIKNKCVRLKIKRIQKKKKKPKKDYLFD